MYKIVIIVTDMIRFRMLQKLIGYKINNQVELKYEWRNNGK